MRVVASACARRKKAGTNPAFSHLTGCGIACEARLSVLAQDSDRHFDHDVGMQRHGDRMVADGLQWAQRHANLRFLDREALLGQRIGDVAVGHGAEQTAIDAGLLRNLDGQAGQFLALGLRRGQFGGGSFFELGALCFELGDGVAGGSLVGNHSARDVVPRRKTPDEESCRSGSSARAASTAFPHVLPLAAARD